MRQTQPGGLMYSNFRGAVAAKAETIRRWVVDFKAVQYALTILGLFGGEASALDVSFVDGTQAGNERSYPVPAADGVTIDRGAQVIIARSSGRIAAMALSCPHQNAAVKWLPNDHRFQCTRHDSKYTPDGTYTSGRATRNMDRFPIRRDGATLHVDVTRVFHSDQDAAGWAAASVTA